MLKASVGYSVFRTVKDIEKTCLRIKEGRRQEERRGGVERKRKKLNDCKDIYVVRSVYILIQ